MFLFHNSGGYVWNLVIIQEYLQVMDVYPAFNLSYFLSSLFVSQARLVVKKKQSSIMN